MDQSPSEPRFGSNATVLAYAGIGAVGGLLSGLFGVGGGVVIVPLLVLALGVDQRRAAGISVAAILPTAIVGAVTYASAGKVDWVAGALLAVGVIGGAQIGSYLLSRLPITTLRWIFTFFLIAASTSLWVVVPERDAQMSIGVASGIALIGVGVLVGVLSGVLGVGGGIMIVPVLMIFFGASDLVAKGTSLLMMIPGSLSGTVANIRRRNVDLRAAATVGLVACLCSPIGVLGAQLLTPFWSNVAFSILLAVVVVQLVTQLLRRRREIE